jgi:hypothetical protein
VLSTRIDTTPEEIRSSVSVHSVSSAAAATMLASSKKAAASILTFVIVFQEIDVSITELNAHPYYSRLSGRPAVPYFNKIRK